MKPSNLLVIMSDEHNPRMLGCAGHDLVKTPHLDRLAARGTRFTSAYCNSPICVPSRAAFATGRYVHETGYWDNALAYDGRVRGWGQRLQEAGHRVESIGKLHYRNAEDPTGFDRQSVPMHILAGAGMVWGSVRDPLPHHDFGRHMLGNRGPGESNYNRYDMAVADAACAWLHERASQREEKPWTLFVGFVAPHFPLTVPAEFFELYPPDAMPPPKLHPDDGHRRHPWLQAMAEHLKLDETFDAAERRLNTALYFGLCSFLDHQVGRVLDALEKTGLGRDTRIVYTSDHGDNVGARGMWGKSTHYEESVGIPLIVAGPDVPESKTSATTTSLVDAYQSVLDCAGLEVRGDDSDLPGKSWLTLAHEPEDPDRLAFSEYHAVGADNASYMVRKGRYKLLYHMGYRPELYDLETDPEESRDLAGEADMAPVLVEYEGLLRAITDPEATDRRAKADQAALVERHGGREAAFQIGARGATPVPGAAPE